MHIPFVDLKAQYKSIKIDIDNAIEQVINETAFIGGKYVKQFADNFAELYGVKHVIPCANGTDSLFIIMKCLGIGPGDEVITAANSWISSSETITQTGARVVFCDVDPIYYSMDEQLLEDLITPRTKAIMAVHLQGQMCQIDTIRQVCERYNLHLIEDCAQAHLSTFEGLNAGLFGDAGSFSFFPGKNLGAYGDAGCIITNNDDLAIRCKMFANHGALLKHHHQIEGINSRLDGMQAAILSAKLPYLNQWTQLRREKAMLYNEYLSGLSAIRTPQVRPQSEHSYHLYVVRAQNRDALQQYLKECGIESLVHYPTPLPFLPAYSYLKHQNDDFPISIQLQQEILSLPIYPELVEDQIKFIADAIFTFYQ